MPLLINIQTRTGFSERGYFRIILLTKNRSESEMLSFGASTLLNNLKAINFNLMGDNQGE